MKLDLVVYQFSRDKVERVDFSHFLSLYSPDKLPSGRRLREMMNTLVFQIDGFNDDQREIHSIPEIRRFYAAFHEAWPYWLYFCNLESEGFMMMVFCCMPEFTAVKVDRRPDVSVEYSPQELARFLGADFGPMNLMCDRGEMFEQGIFDRSKAIFEYFGLPYNAQL